MQEKQINLGVRPIWQIPPIWGGNLDISEFQRGRGNKNIFSQSCTVSTNWDMGTCVSDGDSINSPLGEQVVESPRSRSLFTLVSKLVSATNGRSWNTGTEVSFGGVGSLDRQSVPHLKIAPNPFPFSYKEKRKRNSGGKETKSSRFRSAIGLAPKDCPKSLSLTISFLRHQQR